MAEAPAHETTAVVFELDRFERIGEDRLEIEGRWSGVRGRRFIRPSLTVATGGSSERLLADLADKPWPPESAAPWRAAFVAARVADLDLQAPELAVAPDISIQLPAPSDEHERDVRIVADGRDGAPPADANGSRSRTATRAKPKTARRAAAAESPAAGKTKTASAKTASAKSSGAAKKRPTLASLQTELATAEAARDRVKDRLEASEARVQSLRDELTAARVQAREAQADAKAAIEKEAAAHAQTRDELAAAREDLRGMAAERDRMLSEHYAARSERDGAVAERDAAVSQRHTAEAERKSAQSERDGMRAARDVADRGRAAAVAERDEAVAARHDAIAERDLALADRDAALAERDAALAEHDTTRSERAAPGPALVPAPAPDRSQEIAALRQDVERLRRERDALAAERTSLAPEPDPAARAASALRAHPFEMPAEHERSWAPRAAAVAFLLACLIALAIITHVF